MSMIARRVFLLPLVLVAALAAGYSALWFVVAGWVEDGLRNWSRQQTERGTSVAFGTLALSGFPGPIRMSIPAPRIASRKEGWQWSAERAELETRPWDWRRFRLEISGQQQAAVPFGGVLRRYSLHPQSALVVAEVDARGRLAQGVLTARDIRLADAGAVEVLSARSVSLHMKQQVPALAGEAAAVELTAQANSLLLGATIETPLERNIRDIAMVATVKGALPETILRDAVDAWRRRGGTLEMSHFQVDWGQLSLRARGTLSLDEALRPLGAVTADIKGYAEALAALERAQVLKRKAVAGTQLALDLMSRRDDGDSRRVVTIPVSAQNGALYVGPVRLLKLAPIPFPVRPG